MLSTIPTELQAQILSHLPRTDLPAVARVSQHLHAVAIKILYRKVEIRSRKHFDSFFLLPSLLPPGSIAAAEHAKARRKQLELIKDLTISIVDPNERANTFYLPRSLKGFQPSLPLGTT